MGSGRLWPSPPPRTARRPLRKRSDGPWQRSSQRRSGYLLALPGRNSRFKRDGRGTASLTAAPLDGGASALIRETPSVCLGLSARFRPSRSEVLFRLPRVALADDRVRLADRFYVVLVRGQRHVDD